MFTIFPSSNKKTGFPYDQPPTLFHPASPKVKPAKLNKDVDAASMTSTSTFASTVSLLKDNVKAKFHSKDHATKKAAAASTVMYEQDGEKKASSPKPKEPSARARTAEAYMVMAVTK
jgi:hypothetical protein